MVPKCIKKFTYLCHNNDVDEKTLFKSIKNANKLQLYRVTGNEACLRQINELADNLGKNLRYLHISFNGSVDSVDLAKLYVDAFRKFSNLETLKIESYSDGNLTNIMTVMNEDDNFPWFSSIRTIKCYKLEELKDYGPAGLFFTKFINLQTFKGIIDDNFFPLVMFPEKNKHVKNLWWSIPENEANRNKVLEFLAYNKSEFLRLKGGVSDKLELQTVH